eukprot:3003774-Amphidinium_carterae.3
MQLATPRQMSARQSTFNPVLSRFLRYVAGKHYSGGNTTGSPKVLLALECLRIERSVFCGFVNGSQKL